MKKVLLVLIILINVNLSQAQQNSIESIQPIQSWSLSTSVGYINVSNPGLHQLKLQSNVWSSINVNYSSKKWSFGTWVGANYWMNGKQPDFRLGLTTTYTIIKW
jgi:hypothetical protein